MIIMIIVVFRIRETVRVIVMVMTSRNRSCVEGGADPEEAELSYIIAGS